MFIESNKIELKSKYTDQIVKEIVAFINADGGKIYIGINDDGTVCGAQKIDELIVYTSNSKEKRLINLSFIIGFLIMMILDLCF